MAKSLQVRGSLASNVPSDDTSRIMLDEKIDRLESEMRHSKDQCEELKTRLNEKNHELCEMNDQVESTVQNAKRREQELLQEMNLLRQDQRASHRKAPELDRLQRDIEAKSDEKNLLQTRHDALTVESQGLQADLTKLRRELGQLQDDLQQERRSASENERLLREDAKAASSRSRKEARDLQQQLHGELDKFAAQESLWGQQKRELEMLRRKAELEADDLRSSIDRFKTGERTISHQEAKLQEAIDAEKQRNKRQESQFAEQIKDLERTSSELATVLDQARSELQEAKANLRGCEQAKAASDAKVQALEDEVDVLQGALHEDAEQAKEDLASTRQHVYDLEEEIEFKKRDLSLLRTTHDEAIAKVELLETVQAESRSHKVAKEDALAQLTDLRSKQHEMEELKAAYRDAMNQADRSAPMKQTLAKADSALNDAQIQLEKLRSEKALLQDQLDDLEAELCEWRSRDGATEAQVSESRRHGASSRAGVDIERSSGHEASLKAHVRALRKERDALKMILQESKVAQQLPWSTTKPHRRLTDDASGAADHQCYFPASQSQLELFLSESRESDQNALRRISDMQKLSQQQFDSLEHQREQLERQLGELRLDGTSNRHKLQEAENTIHRLRDRVAELEAERRSVKISRNTDTAMATARKDLHELLKSAKLEAEAVQLELRERDRQIQGSSAREQDVRSQLQRVRSESRLRQKQAAALSKELESLQQRYETKIDEARAKQRDWEEERRKLCSKMESSNPPRDTQRVKKLELEAKQRELRHANELKSLAKQTQLYRALCKREERFREGLAFGKQYLLLQVEMYQAW